ncbi:hypothetical protein [Roseovarius sp. E0-M6]|uniref:hypothetical protein n=1 Tax=Roseovarius sp. E0-M6 TaxID=3127118 RepID=UPI00300FAD63
MIKRRSGPGRRFFFETDQLTVADKTRTLRDRVWPFGKPFTDGPFRLILLTKKEQVHRARIDAIMKSEQGVELCAKLEPTKLFKYWVLCAIW